MVFRWGCVVVVVADDCEVPGASEVADALEIAVASEVADAVEIAVEIADDVAEAERINYQAHFLENIRSLCKQTLLK